MTQGKGQARYLTHFSDLQEPPDPPAQSAKEPLVRSWSTQDLPVRHVQKSPNKAYKGRLQIRCSNIQDRQILSKLFLKVQSYLVSKVTPDIL